MKKILSLEEIVDIGIVHTPDDSGISNNEWEQLLHTAREYHRLREVLESIAKDRDYVESESTGLKYWHKTPAAQAAREALKECDE